MSSPPYLLLAVLALTCCTSPQPGTAESGKGAEWARVENEGEAEREVGSTYRVVLDTRIHLPTAGAKYDAFGDVPDPRYRLMRVAERVEE